MSFASLGFQKLSVGVIVLLSLTLGACSQGRYSLLAANRDTLWAPQALCSNVDNFEVLGCFDIQINGTRNIAYLDVRDIDPESASAGYRVLGRRFDRANFDLLADRVFVGAGGTVDLIPPGGSDIRDYEEFRVELMINRDTSGISFEQVPAGRGLPMAHAIIQFPEAYSGN